MTEAMDNNTNGANIKIVQPELSNSKLRTHLHEYGRHRRTDGPYADNLEVDALVMGGGFAGVFMFWSRKAGLKTVIYEEVPLWVELGFGIAIVSLSFPVRAFLTNSSWGYGRFGSSRISTQYSRAHQSVCLPTGGQTVVS
jgi:hypothetical protein